jgi:hypothetical protein
VEANKGKFSFAGIILSVLRELSNVQLRAGWVNETLPPFLDANPIEPVGLLLIDFCVESSTAYVLDQIVSRLHARVAE